MTDSANTFDSNLSKQDSHSYHCYFLEKVFYCGNAIPMSLLERNCANALHAGGSSVFASAGWVIGAENWVFLILRSRVKYSLLWFALCSLLAKIDEDQDFDSYG